MIICTFIIFNTISPAKITISYLIIRSTIIKDLLDFSLYLFDYLTLPWIKPNKNVIFSSYFNQSHILKEYQLVDPNL